MKVYSCFRILDVQYTSDQTPAAITDADNPKDKTAVETNETITKLMDLSAETEMEQ